MSSFFAWKEARDKNYPDNPVPEDILTCSDPALTLNTHLLRFVVETRKVNGELYPPKTVHQLLYGLLRHMRDVNPELCPNFLDTEFVSKTNNGTFKKLHVTSKVGPMFASVEAGERCPVKILDHPRTNRTQIIGIIKGV